MNKLNFDQAMTAMIEGKKVKGEDWGENEFIYYENSPDNFYFRSVFDEEGIEVPAATLIANLDCSWYIVE